MFITSLLSLLISMTTASGVGYSMEKPWKKEDDEWDESKEEKKNDGDDFQKFLRNEMELKWRSWSMG